MLNKEQLRRERVWLDACGMYEESLERAADLLQLDFRAYDWEVPLEAADGRFRGSRLLDPVDGATRYSVEMEGAGEDQPHGHIDVRLPRVCAADDDALSALAALAAEVDAKVLCHYSPTHGVVLGGLRATWRGLDMLKGDTLAERLDVLWSMVGKLVAAASKQHAGAGAGTDLDDAIVWAEGEPAPGDRVQYWPPLLTNERVDAASV